MVNRPFGAPRKSWQPIPIWLLILCCALPFAPNRSVAADADQDRKGGDPVEARQQTDSKQQPESGKKPREAIDPLAESQVVALVADHLPELREILDRLRDQNPRQYERAIRDLAKSSRRLQTAKDRGEPVYELELDLWKANNSVNLLVARLKVRDRPTDRDALRQAVAWQQRAERARIQYDVDLLRQRIDRATQQLDSAQQRLLRADEAPQAQRESTYEKLLRKAGRTLQP